MHGIRQNDIVLAATNQIDALDPSRIRHYFAERVTEARSWE